MKTKDFKTTLYGLIVPIMFLIMWGILSNKIGNEVILPKISSVLNNFAHATQDFIGLGSLPTNIFVSLIRVILGYTAGVILAIPLGLLMGYKNKVYGLFNTFINIFRPIPPLAWVPLVLAWFGVSSFATIFNLPGGEMQAFLNNFKFSMVFIIGLGTFFPVLTNTVFAVRTVPKTLIESAKVLGASERDIFLKILLPASAPTIITGLRTGLGIAWSCLVSAEMLPGSLSGVGYLITHAYELGRTDLVITGVTCIGLIGASLDYIYRLIEKRHFSWQNKIR
ncbi:MULTISPECIES: ABC transporter permease [Clostridium]|uniref:NitT/TauT family transport system permease protein n=2 Tax=Clostridium cadaveris TaxID=1529 RepID=A0A1I2KN85_9CLOT|nr:ABC transporter permease [Clostridium cadaveris]MDU4953000.1 ABC transporter permease [Clostridium sp.]MDM8312316.1 ABC transporter permease [Clostridium cadaveris]MDY4949995.1 ABC transporter permease [Clostridium cadaveris]UFH65077.1 ABC transporter permease [Clostridium cadaveris]SFF67828.1 NitT/TauT family transport system permease protein [Clostridium cadaveris]